MDFSNISRQLNEGMKSKAYKAPKVPGNLQDKDRAEKLDGMTAEKPFKGGRNWMKEGMEAVEAAQSSAEKAVASGEKQIQGTNNRKNRQKSQMAQQKAVNVKSDISYASEEARMEREELKMIEEQKSDWRQELIEAAGPNDDPNHPFVDVMPFMNNKLNQAKKQMKAAGGDTMREGGKQAKMAEGSLNPFQQHFDKDGKPYTSKGSKESRDRIAKNIASNRKRGPLAQDPYKSRAGESD